MTKLQEHLNTALILARLDSNRLPQKALQKIGDHSLIEWVINRVKKTTYSEPILLTSSRAVDNALDEVAKKHDIHCYRGDLDVASRVYNCIIDLDVKTFARVNGDSPFVDWNLLDVGFELMMEKNADFVSNLVPRTYPYGVSVEILKSSLFVKYYSKIRANKKYREHITSFFYEHKNLFQMATLHELENPLDHLYLTIDTPEDLEYIRKMFIKNPELLDLEYQEVVKIIGTKN